MLTKHHHLPKTIKLDGVKYNLEWDSNGNMDGWVARFNLGRTFSTEPDALWFWNNNNEFAACPFEVFPNGDVICRVKAS